MEYFIAWVHGYVVRAEQLEDAMWRAGTRTPEAARTEVPLPERLSQLQAATGAVERVLVRYRSLGGVIRREEAMRTDWAMTQATEAGDVAVVAELIAQTPELITRFSSLGWAPLHMAAHAGQGPVVEFLLAHGAEADVPAHNDLRSTPLLRAVMAGYIEIVVLLLAHGANVNIANSAGATPLHKAAIQGDRQLVRLLLDHGARPEARNSGGQTPLHHAEYQGHRAIIAMLQQEAPRAAEDWLVPHG
ncbi:MAG TPA: ankyrin repeat domain-containing protein [Steroidobacteraceae bacterium]|nr:ankyrin repeat domain-containing protein [Steroidobacteraceae bacterium]